MMRVLSTVRFTALRMVRNYIVLLLLLVNEVLENMENNVKKLPMIFDIHVAEGSHYEVGKQRAMTLKQHYPEDVPYFISPMGRA
ncbi:Uncharacterised protein [Chlamydia abortus]|nr:Uncharacterised protein [Chlamydia abortus]